MNSYFRPNPSMNRYKESPIGSPKRHIFEEPGCLFSPRMKPVQITKIKGEPRTHGPVDGRRSVRDKLMEIISSMMKSTKLENSQKNHIQPKSTRLSVSQRANSKERRYLYSHSDFKDRSFQVIPLILHKRPQNKEDVSMKSTRFRSELGQSRSSFMKGQKLSTTTRYNHRQNLKTSRREGERLHHNSTGKWQQDGLCPWMPDTQ